MTGSYDVSVVVVSSNVVIGIALRTSLRPRPRSHRVIITAYRTVLRVSFAL
jgi:hypothetical protein